MISSTMVCTYDLKIIYAQVGDFGSINDARAIREGALGKNAGRLFAPNQYIFGDGAYPKKSWLLPVQRTYRRNELSGSDIKFNKCISKMRVRIENCFAALKGRFPSVDSLRAKIKSKKDVNAVNDWVLTCCILHNFCLKHDTNKSLEYFSDVFFNENIKLQERIQRIQREDYLDSLEDEEDVDDSVPTGDVFDRNEPCGKSLWEQEKRIVLEKFHGRNIADLDRIHNNRYSMDQ